jgi:uncharacterized membrane protein
VQFVLLSTILALLVYFGWRTTRGAANRPTTRVIGPDDDPEFLRHLGHDDNSR